FFQAEDGIRDDLVTGVQRVLFRSSGTSIRSPTLRAGGEGSAMPSKMIARPRRRRGQGRAGARKEIRMLVPGRDRFPARFIRPGEDRKSVGEGKSVELCE